MGIAISWDNQDQTIILVDYQPPWTWLDFDASIDQINALTSSVSYHVDLIVDVSLNNTLPPDALTRFRGMGAKLTHSQGIVVLVGGNLFDKALMNTVQKTTRTDFRVVKIHFVEIREQARTFLEQSRQARFPAEYNSDPSLGWVLNKPDAE